MARAAPFGLLIDGTPNSEENDLAYLNAAVSLWGSVLPNTPTPLPGTDETFYRLEGGAAPTAAVSSGYYRLSTVLGTGILLNGTADYIVAHFGGQFGGRDLMYYVSGISGMYYLSPDNLPPGISIGGISSITLFGQNLTLDSGTSVPDGGASLALFGIGLCGLVTFARCQKKS
jgi:hypothetical protein